MVLKKRGVKTEELMHIVRLLLSKAKKVKTRKKFIDICGTGGDRSNSFNISTTVGFVLAGGGLSVLKHGNRAVSSQCGSSDLLESVGVDLEKASKRAEKTLKKVGFGYLHAPLHHPFFAKVAPLRKKIGEATLFNFLGPLLHPAVPQYQLTGVSDPDAFHQYADWMKALGRKRAFIVRGEGGMDEATPYGVTQVYEVDGRKVVRGEIHARDHGLGGRGRAQLEVRDRKENISVFKGILKGKERGAKYEAVILNAGLGFFAAGKVKDLRQGIVLSRKTIESGSSMRVLDDYVRMVS
jgi:anthranilate phosphoribosyltransferase